MDFVFDRVAGGRAINCLVVVDHATHEAVAIEPEHALGGQHLVRVLERICAQRGYPQVIRVLFDREALLPLPRQTPCGLPRKRRSKEGKGSKR